jgi:hypothetical protein
MIYQSIFYVNQRLQIYIYSNHSELNSNKSSGPFDRLSQCWALWHLTPSSNIHNYCYVCLGLHAQLALIFKYYNFQKKKYKKVTFFWNKHFFKRIKFPLLYYRIIVEQLNHKIIKFLLIYPSATFFCQDRLLRSCYIYIIPRFQN